MQYLVLQKLILFTVTLHILEDMLTISILGAYQMKSVFIVVY